MLNANFTDMRGGSGPLRPSWPRCCRRPLGWRQHDQRRSPALHDAVDHDAALEQVLPLLLGRRDALAVRLDGRIVGKVDVDPLGALLVPGPSTAGETEVLP